MSFLTSSCSHNPLNCIIPEYLLDELSRNQNQAIREAAIQTMAFSRALVANRLPMSQLAQFESAAAAGTVGLRRLVYTADNTFNLRRRLMRPEGGPASGDSAVDEAYDGFGNTYNFYQTVFNRNSVDGAGLPMIGTVHIGNEFNNAVWTGREMGFGDGDDVLFTRFTRSLDVIGHELTHGVVQFNGNGGLLYKNQSGALNESTADVFGTLVKQFTLGQDVYQADWLLGSEIMVAAPSLRSMKDPHQGLGTSPNGTPGQPKHMSEYDHTTLDNEGVHINSGIPNHAFYLFATRLGGNAWDKAGRVWYDTLTRGNLPPGQNAAGDETPPFTTFQLFADKTVSFTQDVNERNALVQSWADVGITVSGVPGEIGDTNQLKQKLEAIRNELNSVIGSL